MSSGARRGCLPAQMCRAEDYGQAEGRQRDVQLLLSLSGCGLHEPSSWGGSQILAVRICPGLFQESLSEQVREEGESVS